MSEFDHRVKCQIFLLVWRFMQLDKVSLVSVLLMLLRIILQPWALWCWHVDNDLGHGGCTRPWPGSAECPWGWRWQACHTGQDTLPVTGTDHPSSGALCPPDLPHLSMAPIAPVCNITDLNDKVVFIFPFCPCLLHWSTLPNIAKCTKYLRYWCLTILLSQNVAPWLRLTDLLGCTGCAICRSRTQRGPSEPHCWRSGLHARTLAALHGTASGTPASKNVQQRLFQVLLNKDILR